MPLALADRLRPWRGLLVFLVLMGAMRSALADWNDVPSSSMRPTIIEGDRIVVDRRAYDLRLPFTALSLARTGEPARGDIVVFDSAAADLRLVKRIVGVPGDVVALSGNRLSVNGEAARYRADGVDGEGAVLRESVAGHSRRIRADAHSPRGHFAPVTVPADHYLVLGDNRDHSADSRVYGFVPRAELLGRAHHVAWSLDRARWLRPRGERFWQDLQVAPDAG